MTRKQFHPSASTESQWMPKLPQPFSNQSVSDWIAQFQQSDDPEQRLRALQALGSLCPPEATAEWAADALRDSDSTVKALASKLLGNLGYPLAAAVEAQLVSLLADADPDVRFESSRALIRTKSLQAELAVPVLLSLLDEPETQPLMIAAVVNALVESDLNSLSFIGELRPRVQRLLDHERAEVREAVANAFAKWPAMAVSLTEQLIPLLDDSEPIVREKIAHAFGRAGVFDDQIQSALETASQDEDAEVARVASESLNVLRGKEKH